MRGGARRRSGRRSRSAGRAIITRSTSPTTDRSSPWPNAMTTGWAAYSGACDDERALAAIEGGLKGIERPDRVLLLETPFYEHSQPYPGRIADYPPGRAGERRPVQPRRVVDRRRLRPARRAGAGQGRDGEGGAPERAGLRDLREDLAAEEDRPRAHRDLRPHSRSSSRPTSTTAGATAGAGGWSWYTGSAARMLSAAYALLGIVQADGRIERSGRPVRAERRVAGRVAADRRPDLAPRRAPIGFARDQSPR